MYTVQVLYCTGWCEYVPERGAGTETDPRELHQGEGQTQTRPTGADKCYVEA